MKKLDLKTADFQYRYHYHKYQHADKSDLNIHLYLPHQKTDQSAIAFHPEPDSDCFPYFLFPNTSLTFRA
ncbi:hypothetical protein D3C87_2033950 [compost metagenome]